MSFRCSIHCSSFIKSSDILNTFSTSDQTLEQCCRDPCHAHYSMTICIVFVSNNKLRFRNIQSSTMASTISILSTFNMMQFVHVNYTVFRGWEGYWHINSKYDALKVLLAGLDSPCVPGYTLFFFIRKNSKFSPRLVVLKFLHYLSLSCS